MDANELTVKNPLPFSLSLQEDDLKQINADADQIVQKMNLSKEKDEIDILLHQLASFGAEEQKLAGETLSSLRSPLNYLMDAEQQAEIPNGLLKMKQAVKDLDPRSLKQNPITRLVSKVLRQNPLEKYTDKYKSVQQTIDDIERGLLRGRDKLEEHTIDLEMIKKDTIAQVFQLEKQVYIGQKIFDALEFKKQEDEWKDKEPAIVKAQEKIIVRVKNMMTMINVLQQSLASTDMTISNNEKMEESIRNALDITKNIGPITATIHLALKTQESVIEAVQTVNQANEDMLAANAHMLKENTKKVNQLLEGPAISFSKLQQSYDDIYQALDFQEQSSRRIVENNKVLIGQLGDLNQTVKTKLLGG